MAGISDTYSLLILSDSHLFADREQELFRVNTYSALRQVTEHIRHTHPVFDLVVATGDLVEDGEAAGYAEFYKLTGNLGTRSIWMKGNHDEFRNLPDELKGRMDLIEFEMGNWRMIFLDSTLPGRDEGALSADELKRLRAFIMKEKSKKPILIFIHHQPLDVGTPFIDELGLKNSDDFWRIIGGNTHLKGVVFGHVHQEFESENKGIRLYSTPSTGIQFKPGSIEVDFDEPWSGYRTLTLFPDGSFNTEVKRFTGWV